MVNWNSAGVKPGDHLPAQPVVKSVVQEGDNLVLTIELTNLPASVTARTLATVTVPAPTKPAP